MNSRFVLFYSFSTRVISWSRKIASWIIASFEQVLYSISHKQSKIHCSIFTNHTSTQTRPKYPATRSILNKRTFASLQVPSEKKRKKTGEKNMNRHSPLPHLSSHHGRPQAGAQNDIDHQMVEYGPQHRVHISRCQDCPQDGVVIPRPDAGEHDG